MPDETKAAVDAKQADADAKAKADAEAKAQADADAKAQADADAKAADRKIAAAAALKETRQRLAARIAAEAPQNRVELVGDLVAREGLKLRTTSEGRTYAKMAGIEAGSRGGDIAALVNWGNAARRALLAEG